MARKEIKMEELVEVLYQWHKGRNISQIKRALELDRKTIRKYIELAEPYGFKRDDEVRDELYYLQLAGRIQGGLNIPLGCSESFKKTALYQTSIEKLLARKYMTPKQVYRTLKRYHEYSLSYSSFKRYINIKYPKEPRSCLRIEVEAAQEAQVDFGSAGMMLDPGTGKLRRGHAFVMTLRPLHNPPHIGILYREEMEALRGRANEGRGRNAKKRPVWRYKRKTNNRDVLYRGGEEIMRGKSLKSLDKIHITYYT